MEEQKQAEQQWNKIRRERINILKVIHIGKPIEMDDAAFKKKLRQLDEAAYQETDRMRKLVAEVVPTYHPENGKYVKVKEA